MTVDLTDKGSGAARALFAGVMALAVLGPMTGGYLRAQDKIAPAQTPAMADAEKLMKENRSDEALRLLHGEVDRNPQRLDLQMALGNTQVRAGKYDEALATFQGILGRVAPESNAAADLWMRMGETQRRKGDWPAAVEALRHAERMRPNDIVAVNTLALVLDGSDRKAEAAVEYRKVLKLDPDNWIALNNLAYLLSASQQQQDLDDALSMAKHAHDVMTDSTEIADTLGWIYLKRNQAEMAIGWFESAVNGAREKSTFHYHLAMAYVQKGDKGSALDQLKAALECKPAADEEEKIKQLHASIQ